MKFETWRNSVCFEISTTYTNWDNPGSNLRLIFFKKAKSSKATSNMCYVGTIAQAFEKTWKLACEKEDGVMFIPPSKAFLIRAMEFKGSCKGNTTFQVKHFHNILHTGSFCLVCIMGWQITWTQPILMCITCTRFQLSYKELL
jgi:hypothetical protein